MAFNYELEKLDSKYSARLRANTDVFLVKLRFIGTSTDTIVSELLTALDGLTAELKSDLDPENDRVGLSLEHPDLIAKSIDVPLQRPKNLTGQLVHHTHWQSCSEFKAHCFWTAKCARLSLWQEAFGVLAILVYHTRKISTHF